MELHEVKSFCSKELEGVTDLPTKIKTINECIQMLYKDHGFIVLCPVSGSPLKAVSISDGVIMYHLF